MHGVIENIEELSYNKQKNIEKLSNSIKKIEGLATTTKKTNTG